MIIRRLLLDLVLLLHL